MTEGRRPDLLVVGGGIAGAAVALRARELGADVLVVERHRPGASAGGGAATGASAGMLAPQYEAEHPDALFRLLLRSRELQPDFLARIEALSGVDVDHRRDGLLVPSFEPHEERRAREDAERQRARGLRAEVVAAGRAEELQPGLPPGVLAATWLPDAAQVDTQRLADALPDALEAAGARAVAAEAAGVLRDGDGARGVRVADGGEAEADAVVVAAGAWSGRLEGLPRELPVEPVRGQMLRYPPGSADVRRLLANHGGRYLVPRADGSVLAGSTMEAAGWDASTTRAGERAIRNAAARLLPGLRDVEPVERWAGLRPGTPDERPVLGPDPGLDGLHYATGFGRNGILLAPAAGRIVAGLALEGSTELDWRPYRPERFEGAAPRTRRP